MKIFKVSVVVLAASFMLYLIGPISVLAATSPALGAAGTYSVLGGSIVTNANLTTVSGDVGVSPSIGVPPHVTGFPPGIVNLPGAIHDADAHAAAAQAANTAAFGVLDQPCDINYGAPVKELGGLSLGPGVYCVGAGGFHLTGNLTLTGSGVWIFKSAATLVTAPGSSVTGGDSCNVWWRVATSATIDTTTAFRGNILALTAITMNTGATLNGRVMAQTAAVTLDTNTISGPTCMAPASSGEGSFSLVPLIGIKKVPSPLVLSAGPGSVTYNYTVWNVGGQQGLYNVSVTDDKCSPVTLISGDLNNDNQLNPGENWKYSCTTTLATTTTNTAVTIGYGNAGQSAIATAIATVAVGVPLTPPLINIVKVPDRLTPFPFGGGNVKYTYTVTNPGVVAMHDIVVTDDKCSPVSRISGDTNGDNLLDISETWTYTCRTNVPVSTRNIATAKGQANGFTALGYAFATVLVSAPGLPNTGFPPEGENTSWDIVILASILMVVSTSIVVALRKRTI